MRVTVTGNNGLEPMYRAAVESVAKAPRKISI
jgi:hypothetical protein